MGDKKTKFELRDVDSLIPYARNARTHSTEQVQKLASSIKEFGFINPVIISEDGGVLAGHGRILAANKLGIKQVPCVVETHLTEAQKKAYILADNRLALDAGWDEEMLSIELGELKSIDFNMDLIGFNEDELKMYLDKEEEMLGDNESEGEEEEKEVEVDEKAEAITQLGDVWILGEHRVICGDSTDPEVVAKVLNGNKPNLMVTDPPYGVHYGPELYKDSTLKVFQNKRTFAKGREGGVLNDDRNDWYDSYALFPGEIAYVWHANTASDVVFSGLKKCGFNITSVIIWNKDQFCFGRSFYHWKHEPCVYATKGKQNWQGDRTQCTVWDIPMITHLTKEEGEWGHSTQKPLECMKRPIENNTEPGEYVYDPFLGSGTTVIAAEKTGRKCLGCELSPNYCDAIVRRWEHETGLKAILEGDGTFFDDLANDKNDDL